MEDDEELMDIFNKVKKKQVISQHIHDKMKKSNAATVGYIHNAFRNFMREDES